MRKTTFQMRLFPPFLRAALALYLLGTLCLAEVHQHHGALQNHDCALCTIVHSPATVVPARNAFWSGPTARPTSWEFFEPPK